MDIAKFTTALDDLVKEKSNELYLEVCKEIIEANGLKEKALEMCNKICDMHIQEESKKDKLTSFETTWNRIKSELKK